MIRVLIVDDQAIVRAGVARILGPDDGFDVVGECDDGDQVVEAIDRLRPDVVLMDVRMRRIDGVEATREIKLSATSPPVMILTTFDDDDVLWGAIDAGAAGFVLKDSAAETLIAATRAVAAGAAWLDPKVAPRVLSALSGSAAQHRAQSQRVERLTEREQVVLRLMARAATNSEIAAKLFVSEATVKSHVGSIFAKLGTRDRAAAIVFAFDQGIVSVTEKPPSP